MNSVMSCILNRRSVRAYTSQEVEKETIMKLLNAATWAPSGHNLQPWRFSVVMNDKELLKKVASLTAYKNWVETAPCLISVFLDTKLLDDKIPKLYLKHAQSIGASIENLMLAAEDLGLGTCWIGEILKNEEEVKNLLNVPNDLELMAVITLGYSSKDNLKSKRKELSENIINWL